MDDTAFKQRLEARLKASLQQKQQAAPTTESKLMISRLEQQLLRAGKRSRPGLLHLTYAAYGGTDTEQLIDIGLALELQHQFLLVHDDIMDNDVVRYDGPNILGYYRRDYPAHKTTVADSMALMAGNLLFTFANQAILDHPTLDDSQKINVLKLIQDTNIGVHAGQQLDIVNLLALQPALDNEILLQTDYLKTALYSIRLPMQVAATLLDIDAAERTKIDAFARSFGILYQLVDDYSDYFVNDSSFDNHPKYRDYRQGKITYPLLVGLQKADKSDVELLQKHAGDKDTTAHVMQTVATILEKSGAKAASQQQIKDYYQQALRGLEALAISEAARAKFVAMLKTFEV